MQPNRTARNISQIYLSILPFLVVALAFAVGHISYYIYLPIWIVNSLLMIFAVWTLGAHKFRSADADKKHVIVVAWLLIVPWIFISMFFGMGPPPTTIKGWVELATEQEIRYIILIVGGISITFGLALLREQLKQTGERFYSLFGFMSIVIAAPLFIINWAYWGIYLPKAFQVFYASGTPAKRPDWYAPLQWFFYEIGIVEVGLIYLSTAAFAAALQKAGWFKTGASRVYIALSFVGLALCVLPVDLPEPLATMGYFSCIPAISILMLYFMAINLLRRAGN